MTAQEIVQRDYMIAIRRISGTENGYRITYVPRGLQAMRGTRGSKHGPEYVAIAQVKTSGILVTWENRPTDPEMRQEDFDQDVRARVELLHEWIGRLTALVSSVREWAEELGWSTRNVDKPMKDSEIGDYRVPGLVLQRDFTRVGLEPIGRSTPGTEGVVDLYLLPAYDDIASLYFYGNRWNLNYQQGNTEGGLVKPISKKLFRVVLDEMTKNGG